MRIARPAQLPADTADFTGREEQVAYLCDFFSNASVGSDPGKVRIAIVTGAGGLGKTTLAVHAAHRVRDKFADGHLYVDLFGSSPQPLSPADALARFLRDLGVDGREIPADEDERAAKYRTTLAERRMLIVLDNARDAAQVRPLLPGSASCAVLVTTRSHMPALSSSRLLDLGVLHDSEARTLFASIVGPERVAAEPEATAELLSACAGLPLAIRICAARLATRSGWSIQAMANRLRDEHHRLDELRAGDLAVRASFQVSFASLPPSDRPGGIAPADAFRLLGLWPGPSISSAAAAALFGSPEHLTEEVLETLVDTYLLESTLPGRYKFHDLIRVYAAERAGADLSPRDREAATSRLLGWYMRTADAAAQALSPFRYNMPLKDAGAEPPPARLSSPDDALGWYDGERVNVVTATQLAAASGLHEIAWRLPVPLFSLFNHRGNWADCIATHRIALDSARKIGNRQGEAWVLNNLGQALGFTRMNEGIEYLKQSLAIRREIGDRIGEAQAANNLADAYVVLGRTDEALDLLRRALALDREVGYRYGEGVALNNLGEAFLDLDRPREAIECLLQARQIFVGIEFTLGVGYAQHNLGRVYMRLGRDADALDSLWQALTIYRATGDKLREAITLRSFGSALARAGSLTEAQQSWIQAATIFDELGEASQASEVRSELDALTTSQNSLVSPGWHLGGDHGPGDVSGSSTDFVFHEVTVECNCKPPRTVQIPRTAYEEGPILCGVCGARFLYQHEPSAGMTPTGHAALSIWREPGNVTTPRFRVLGPLEIRAGEDWLGIGAPKWRSVLAMLLMNAGEVVPTSSLIHEIWNDNPPAKAANILSIYVLRLRRIIGDGADRLLLTHSAGYQLRIEADDLDAQCFEDMVERGDTISLTQPGTAAALLTKALELWHGSALADVPPSAKVMAEAKRLEELRLKAIRLHARAIKAMENN